MLLNFRFVKILAFLICFRNVEGLCRQNKWIHDMVAKVKHEAKVHQLIILTDGITEKQDSMTNNLINEITYSLPVKVLNYKNVAPRKFLDLVKGDNVNHLRRTTLFITIKTVKNNHFQLKIPDFLNILSHLSGRNDKAKMLTIIISKEKLSSYGALLQQMWTKDLLDFTVLEVIRKQLTNHFLINDNCYSISVHQFNPFTKIYTKKNYSAKTVIFPNKLSNLNGFEIKVISITESPTLFVVRNISGFPIKVTGPDSGVTKILSKVMNFKITEIASERDYWGYFDPDPNKMTDVFYKLANKKVQFSTNIGQQVAEIGDLLEFSRAINFYCYVPIVPIIKTKSLVLEYSQRCLYMGMLMILLIILPVIVNYILKFNKYFWCVLYMFEAALGLCIPREPNRVAERIVFIITLFAFFISSSAIYAVFTDFKLTTELEIEITTLEDLRNAKLALMTNENYAGIIQSSINDEIVQSMAKKVLIAPSLKSCIRYLINHRNVTCIMRDRSAYSYVNGVRNESALFKVAKLCLRTCVSSLILRPGSPSTTDTSFNTTCYHSAHRIFDFTGCLLMRAFI